MKKSCPGRPFIHTTDTELMMTKLESNSDSE